MPAPAIHRTKLIRAPALWLTTAEITSWVVAGLRMRPTMHIEEWPMPESARVRRSVRKVKRAIRGTVSWSLPGVVQALRMPCPTCPWRKSVPKRGFPGGLIDCTGLMRMVRGGIDEKIMQCHCSRDSAPEVCVGFVLQVGRESAACRLAVFGKLFDPEQMGTDEELHSLQSLLLMHGGVPDRKPQEAG